MKIHRNNAPQNMPQNGRRPFFTASPKGANISAGAAGNQYFIQRDGEQSERDRQVAAAEQAMANNAAPAPAPEPTAQPESASEASGPSNRQYLGELVGGIVEGQIGDSGFRGHINTLAGVLQGLAENATDEVVNDPDRLAALGVENAFKNSATAILNDPGLRSVRQAIIETISDHDEVALVAALAGGIAAYLMDVDLEGSPEFDLGRGATLGGEFDMGSIQSIEFNKLQIFFQYANDYFQSRSTVSLRREVSEPNPETGDLGGEETFIGTAMGQLRLGTRAINLTGNYTLGTDGTAIFTGVLNAGHEFGNGSRFAFTTNVTHNVQESETTVSPGLTGRVNLGNHQQLNFGASANISSNDGLEGLSGHIEYQRSQFQVRLEGNMEGIPGDRSLAPIGPEGNFGTPQPLHFQLTLGGRF